MDASLDVLIAALPHWLEPQSSDLVSRLNCLPEPGTLPSPWETWTLFGLVRHRERQLWVADIIRYRLQGAPEDLARLGAFGHPDRVEQSGTVPGMPEWEYYFHGRGCCITHKVDGDRIDVDFFNDSAEYFDTFFYEHYLKSLRRPEPVEQQLRELHPSASTVSIAVADLITAGALTPLPGRDSHPYRVADEVVAVADEIEAFCTAWSAANDRVWLAATIGDWLAADAAATGRHELSAITRPNAQRCQAIREQRLRKDLGVQFRESDALRALADLPATNVKEYLERALEAQPSGLISAALEIIGKQDDPTWCDRVYDLLRRVSPNQPLPQPHIWMTSLKFLLRHGYKSADLIASLANAGGSEVGEAVLLALEHAPEKALPLIRKSLLDDIPINRTQVAAILALINAPWSKRELLAALEASDDQEKTADARAAILETGDEEAQKAVLAWEQRNPHEKEAGSYIEIDGRMVGPCYTFSEHALNNRAERIRYEMQELHDRVKKVKNVVPPIPSSPNSWWNLWRS